jgi:CPA2 family monovalent cation:H+ antiporter-2
VLVVDAALIAGIVIGASLAVGPGGEAVETHLGLDRSVGKWMVVGAAGLAAVPFCAGVLRNGRRLGEVLAATAMPELANGKVDLAAAPRRALMRTLQFATVSLTSLPILAVTQPFVPGGAGAAVLAVPLVALGVAVWRGATNLHGHVRAGAQLIVEALARHAQGPETRHEDPLAHLRAVLPGLGEPVAVRLEEGCGAVGKTLAMLDLRGRTGATVLALWRAEGGVMVPSAKEELRSGDVLALAGAVDSVAAARELLAMPGRAVVTAT